MSPEDQKPSGNPKRLSAPRVIFYLLAAMFAGVSVWAWTAPVHFPSHAWWSCALVALACGLLARFAPRGWLDKLLGPWP